MRSALRPTARATTLPPPDQGGITLDQVRPHPRVQNEYVDSPRGQPLGGSLLKTPSTPQGSAVIIGGGTRDTHPRVILPGRGVRALNTSIISTQPPVSISPPLKKDPVVVEEDDSSIICRKCGKCKCGACTEPRELPSRWLFGDKCQISPDAVVETCTCFCCIKGVFYHCGKDEQDSDYVCYTDPCASCSKPHCCKRWTCMAIMTLCLPCLCLYWPAKGALKACTMCYNKCRKKGCQCSSRTSKHSHSDQTVRSTQSTRLLIESDSSTGSS